MSFDPAMALTTVRLARFAYRPLDQAERDVTELGLTKYRQFSGPSTQAFVAADDQHTYLSFRGTESRNHIDWMRDAEFRPVLGAFETRVHSGFRRALDEVWRELLAVVTAAEGSLVITGHSLGAGLATLAAARLVDRGEATATVYSYGAPRVGLRDFAAEYNRVLGARTYRVINHIDVVTRVPLLVQGYRHVGKRMYFDGGGHFHPDAGAWHIARDDLVARFRTFGRITSVGIAPHDIPRYVERIESIQ